MGRASCSWYSIPTSLNPDPSRALFSAWEVRAGPRCASKGRFKPSDNRSRARFLSHLPRIKLDRPVGVVKHRSCWHFDYARRYSRRIVTGPYDEWGITGDLSAAATFSPVAPLGFIGP